MTWGAEARDGRHGDIKRYYRFADLLEHEAMKSKFDPEEARASMLTIAAHATDVEDARLLLDMVGLLPERATEPADDRRALGWRRP